ncbi:MAG TPA: rhamnulokinase family protein [Bacteroidales bacterium]|nr:rhamnulokinase family protein [Bacteroidales bacterium]
MNHFLAFDLGASSGRAILGTLKNRKISLKEVHRFENGMLHIHGNFHWNVFSLFEELKNGLSKCCTELKVCPETLGVDTWGVDFGLLDSAGKLIGIPYAYRDNRNISAMEEVYRIIPKNEIYRLTGIAMWPFNSLYQLHAWKRDQADVLGITKTLLFMPDIFNWLFSGVKSTDYTFASTSQLINPHTRTWEPVLFEKLGLPLNIMNEILEPGTPIGKLVPELAQQLNLKDLSVVAVGSHDTASAIVSVPTEGNDYAYISSGTWSLMGIESDVPVISDKTLEYNLTNEGGVGRKIRLLKNIMGLWLLQECRRIWLEKGNGFTYPELVTMAEKAKPFQSIIDPDWMKFYNPDDMTREITGFCKMTGQTEPSEPGQFVRIILEGLAFKYRMVLDQLREVSGKSLGKIHIIGGGSQNELLSQFTANATGVPVVTGPVEATAIGNLMVQTMAKGHVSSLDEIREVIRNSFNLKTFLPENQSEWEKAYQRYLDVLKLI